MRFLLIDRKGFSEARGQQASTAIACETVDEVEHQLHKPVELGRPLSDFIVVIEQDNGMAEVFHNTKTDFAGYLRELESTAEMQGVCGRALENSQHINMLKKFIDEQKKWIEDHGSDEAGYIAHYGVPGTSRCYGNGGKAIYKADLDALRAFEAQMTTLERRDLTVEEAREKDICRVCKQPAHSRGGPMPKDAMSRFGEMLYNRDKPDFKPLTLDFGKEFAHTECLKKAQK